MQTYHIHIKGVVQGVGFRPFVYQIARRYHLTGWVNNTTDGVHIEINAQKQYAQLFLEDILKHLPPLAIVTEYSIKKVNSKYFDNFNIIESKGKTQTNVLLTPDVAMCPDCRRELYDIDNRRYKYPFITCTNCGPRYSIITALPYDRPYTTMNKFEMCPVCKTEYENPLERRHFSQTNSCPDCPIEMQWYENGKITEHFTDLDKVIQYWNAGKIIAIKGIGGYLLTCDATNADAVKTLRQRKQRPNKPFALMYPSLISIEKDAVINGKERKELQSIHSPIVLLQLKKQQTSLIATKEIIKNLGRIGVMLPYTPLYDLLLNKFGKPIIATSGNMTGSTIIYDDQTAIDYLTQIADVLLMNNRDIVIPQDDGLVQFTTKHRQKIVLRRSRGKAPIYINPELSFKNKDILATGGMLKSVFAFTHQNNIFISQFLGNTENYEAQNNYEKTFKHLSKIIKPDIKIIVTDKHPGYFATEFGKKYAQKNSIKHDEIQHHKAHFLSVLAENNLLDNQDKILGIIWDGTGLGDDGNIWGGEFFSYQKHNIKRLHHIGEFDFIVADKMVKEPRISALAIGHKLEVAQKYLQPKFTNVEWQIYNKMLSKPQLKSTSMGRLFDGIASLIFGYDKHNFEAEASMKLEWQATRFLNKKQTKGYQLTPYAFENFTAFIFEQILNDLDKQINNQEIAAKFHLTLVDYIWQIAEKYKFEYLAFSGGVFQNALLIDLLIDMNNKRKKIYFHKELSPNDEGLVLGQLVSAINKYKDTILK